MDVKVVLREDQGGVKERCVCLKGPTTAKVALQHIRLTFLLFGGTIVDSRGVVVETLEENCVYYFEHGISVLALPKIANGLLSQPPMGVIGSRWNIGDFRVFGQPELEDPVYVRSAMINVWEKLEALTFFNRMIIIGSPGSGKSTLLYGWIRYRCEHHAQVIVYVQYVLSTRDHLILLSQKDKVTKYRFSDMAGTAALFDLIKYLVALHRADVVVIDGYREDQLLPMMCLKGLKDSRIVYAASNELFTLHERDYSLLKSEYGVMVCNMDSWTCLEYLAGVRAGCFSNLSLVGGVIEQFFYSGGNVKLFVMEENEDITKFLTNAIRDVSVSDLASGMMGRSMTPAANILCSMQTSDDTYAASKLLCTVSEHAGKLLLKHCDVEALLQATAFVFGSKLWYNTWVFECVVQRSLLLRNAIVHGAGTDHAWNKYAQILEIESFEDISVKSLKPQTLLIYKGLDNSSFDMILYESVGKIRLAKITTATRMNFSAFLIVDILDILKDEFGKCTMHFDIIAPYMIKDRILVKPTDFYHISEIAIYDDNWVPDKFKPDDVYRVLLFKVDWGSVYRKVCDYEHSCDSIVSRVIDTPVFDSRPLESRKRPLARDLEIY